MRLAFRVNVAIFIVAALFLLRGQLNTIYSQWHGSGDLEIPLDSINREDQAAGQDVANDMTEVASGAGDSDWLESDGEEAERLGNNAQGDKVIVMGKLQHEDTDWVAKHLADWQHAIYTVDNTSAPLHTSINKGHEALPYLTYIIDNYDALPSTLVFIHSHQKGLWGHYLLSKAWHTDAAGHDNVQSLRTLNLDFVQRNGYANLRCLTSVGCSGKIKPFRGSQSANRGLDVHIFDAWHVMFADEEVPIEVGTPCCAQFAVSKQQVLLRPLNDYVRYRQWLLDTDLEDSISGRVFEYLWHVIFGRSAVYCPDVAQCYRDVYNIESNEQGFLQP